MIWYSQNIGCLDHPPEAIELRGIYNHPPSDLPTIQIELIINNDHFEVYSKNPSMQFYNEYPESEDILTKYNHIISKLYNIIQSKTLQQLYVKYKTA